MPALDSSGIIIKAKNALKGHDYKCLECGSTVRVRSGEKRVPHFYHVHDISTCRQSGKSSAHLDVQQSIQKIIPETTLERYFPEVGRIADVCWEKERVIFEVQCSPITTSELQARNNDYKKIGYEVIWILHTSRYGTGRLSPIELALKNRPHYYTSGRGLIFDQRDVVVRGRRKRFIRSRALHLGKIKRKPLHISGDFTDFPPKAHKTSLLMSFKRAYFSLFDYVLEKACRRP